MTLDEAIQHCDEVAAECELYEIEIEYACGKEHRQLAAWLRELKELKKYSVPEEDYIILKNENDDLKAKLNAANEAIQVLSERPDEKCGFCKFKNYACIDCSFVYDSDKWFKEK